MTSRCHWPEKGAASCHIRQKRAAKFESLDSWNLIPKKNQKLSEFFWRQASPIISRSASLKLFVIGERPNFVFHTCIYRVHISGSMVILKVFIIMFVSCNCCNGSTANWRIWNRKAFSALFSRNLGSRNPFFFLKNVVFVAANSSRRASTSDSVVIRCCRPTSSVCSRFQRRVSDSQLVSTCRRVSDELTWLRPGYMLAISTCAGISACVTGRNIPFMSEAGPPSIKCISLKQSNETLPHSSQGILSQEMDQTVLCKVHCTNIISWTIDHVMLVNFKSCF